MARSTTVIVISTLLLLGSGVARADDPAPTPSKATHLAKRMDLFPEQALAAVAKTNVRPALASGSSHEERRALEWSFGGNDWKSDANGAVALVATFAALAFLCGDDRCMLR